MMLPHRRSRGAWRFRTRRARADVEIVGISMKMAGSCISSVLLKMTKRKRDYRVFLIFAGVLLASACGGGSSSTGSSGGQGGGQGSVSFSTNAISFKAAGPFAQAPATQTITGTVTGVSSGTLYVRVVANNPSSFFSVTSVTITGNSGQLGVIPTAPSTLNAGNFSGSVTINVCLNDPTCKTGQLTGSPQVISVAYNIASGVDGDTVTPRVVPANAAGTAILRGAGFTGATSVSFGSSAATSVSAVSDSEIDVSYPALPAGTYPITIDSGGINYTASLLAVALPGFTQTLLAYPSGVGAQGPLGIEYDAQRSALFIVLRGSSSTNQIVLRYAFDENTNTWGSPTQISMANLEQVHLSPDGSHLLALVLPDAADTSMVELDPVTMGQTGVTTFSSPVNNSPCGFALANDGNAILGLPIGILPSGPLPGVTGGFVFGTFSRVATPTSDGGTCYPVASGNGAIVQLGGPYITPEFVASQEMIANSGAETSMGSTADLAGDLILNGPNVESETGQLLGGLNTGVGNSFYLINWAGTRAYGYTPNVSSCTPTLSTFDLTATTSGGEYPVLGAPVSLPKVCDNGPGDLLAITPDGTTAFIAGSAGVFVQPLP